MANITNLSILNPADKTRMYAVATGNGTVAEATDPIVTNTKDFPVGSQYTDLTGGNFYVRIAAAKETADWKKMNPTL